MLRAAIGAVLSRLSALAEPPQKSFLSGPAYFSVGPGCQVENIGGLFEKYLGVTNDGFYVEIGAYDGISHSNTIGLARRGWGGILAEPHPESVAKLRANYEIFPKIAIEQVAVGRTDGEVLNLRDAGTLSSTSSILVSHYEQLSWAAGSVGKLNHHVESVRLDTLLERHDPERIDLLVVDVEGSETDVFSGFSIDRWRPSMVIVELVENHPDFHNFRSESAQLYLDILARGYTVVAKDSINTVFVRDSRFQEKNFS